MAGKVKKNTVLAESLSRVNNQVMGICQSQDPFLSKWLGPAAAVRGKRLRVRLTLLSAQLCGSVNSTVERLATALELFHFATLVHDDVIDNAATRRHHPSLNNRFGNEIAVLVGDYLFTQVMGMLFDKIPASVQKLVLNAASRVCLGEAQEHHLRGKRSLSLEEYKQIVASKTASLFSTCCSGAAQLAKAKKTQVEHLAKYGLAFGMAFQIQDDILDIQGKPSRVGKALGTDLKEGRMTLPLILGLKKLKGAKRQELNQAISARDKGLARIQILLANEGIMVQAQAMANAYAQEAIRHLQVFPDSEAKREMIRLADYAVSRDR